MAAQWTPYYSSKKYMMSGAIDVDSDAFRMALFTSASNAATATLSTYASVSNEVTEAFGYSSSGKALTGITWATGASARVYRWSHAALVWTAAGGNIANVKYAVIWDTTSGKLMCFAQLSTAQFTIASGTTMTMTPSSSGVFELT